MRAHSGCCARRRGGGADRPDSRRQAHAVPARSRRRLGRQLRPVKRTGERQEAIKAFTREQLAHLLGTAAREERHWATLFFTMARTGLRLAEALALQWEDVHFRAREIRVARGFSRGHLDTPKSRHGRTVDMSQQLARTLVRLHVERKTETLRRGWTAVPPRVFCTKRGTPLDITNWLPMGNKAAVDRLDDAGSWSK